MITKQQQQLKAIINGFNIKQGVMGSSDREGFKVGRRIVTPNKLHSSLEVQKILPSPSLEKKSNQTMKSSFIIKKSSSNNDNYIKLQAIQVKLKGSLQKGCPVGTQAMNNLSKTRLLWCYIMINKKRRFYLMLGYLTIVSYFINFSKTTDYLKQTLLQFIRNPNIIGFDTVEQDLPVDYYLTQSQKSLMIFKDRVLNLKAFYKTEMHNNKITLKDFLFIKCIGMGGFSRVYLVRQKQTGLYYAMKLIDKEFILKNKKQGIVRNERDIMSVINHPFAVKLEYAFESRNYVIFVMEFCSGGELFWQIQQQKKMSEEQAKFYFAEICLAMHYLHQLGIVYRDIKPENIMIDIEGHVKIADFGLAKPNMGREDYAYSFCGSPEYMAPEMLLKQGHNCQIDHYCLGALLYELVTGLPPFYQRNIQKLYDSILHQTITFPDNLHLSDEVKVILKKGVKNENIINQGPHSFAVGQESITQIVFKKRYSRDFIACLVQKC